MSNLIQNGNFDNWTPANPTELLTDGGMELWTPDSTPELLTDPGLGAWNDPHDLTNYDEQVFGTSTVNRESLVTRGGSPFSARLDIDAANDAARFYKPITLPAATRYCVSMWHKETGTATAGFIIYDGIGNYLKADYTWAPGYYVHPLPHADDWTLSRLFFTTLGNTNYGIFWTSASAASQSIYIDDVSLKLVPTNLTNWTESVSGSSTVNRDGDVQRSGQYACRLDVVAGAFAQILQAVALSAVTRYRFAVFGRTSIDKVVVAQITDVATSKTWRPVEQSWDAGTIGIPKSSVGAFSSYIQEVITVGANDYQFVMKRLSIGGTDNYSGWWDDASLIAIPTNADSWTESISGNSVVLRDQDKGAYSGLYCCRLQVDDAGSAVSVSQSPLLQPYLWYRLTYKYQTSNNAQIAFSIQNNVTGHYLQSDFTWAATLYVFEPAAASDWTNVQMYFKPSCAALHTIKFANGQNSAGEMLWLDAVSLYDSHYFVAPLSMEINADELELVLSTEP